MFREAASASWLRLPCRAARGTFSAVKCFETRSSLLRRTVRHYIWCMYACVCLASETRVWAFPRTVRISCSYSGSEIVSRKDAAKRLIKRNVGRKRSTIGGGLRRKSSQTDGAKSCHCDSHPSVCHPPPPGAFPHSTDRLTVHCRLRLLLHCYSCMPAYLSNCLPVCSPAHLCLTARLWPSVCFCACFCD